MAYDPKFMELALAEAKAGTVNGAGGPFGAVIVKNGIVVGKGHNCVTSSNDPTAHAEVVAIRAACNFLGDFQLTGCELYATCEPCPMCLGAIYWARPDRVFFAATRHDAADAGFDDAHIYSEVNKDGAERRIPMLFMPDPLVKAFMLDWKKDPSRPLY
jgi:tRNA(Arg) A34 adenosine deaminase TadA